MNTKGKKKLVSQHFPGYLFQKEICSSNILYSSLGNSITGIAIMPGLIWYVMPMSLITINDIGAYMVGFFGGKTPLIKLSPKKTREGFIGGGIITVILGTILTHYLIQVTRSYIRLIIWSDYLIKQGFKIRGPCRYTFLFWVGKNLTEIFS